MIKTLRPYQAKIVDDTIKELIKDAEPALIMASVGAGKSLIIAEIIRVFEKKEYQVLCIVSNAELVRSNSAAFEAQGGKPSVFCSSLKSKCIDNNVIFATPQSVLAAIKKNHEIKNIDFDLIIVDEAHMINLKNHQNTFMRILRHYKQSYPEMRLLGATGTNFRFKGEKIVGEQALFKKQVSNVTTHELISQGYLVKPAFIVPSEDNVINFKDVTLKKTGMFDAKQLRETITKNGRKTALIMKWLHHVMVSKNRFGVFIFASTVEHCHECLNALPKDISAIITGETPQIERMRILDLARAGKIKYLINVSVLTVGVDVAPFDTVCYVRPTESLVLMTQTLGRGLRLAPNKTDCLVIDCAGNIERHRDWDDPLLAEAVAQTLDAEKEYIFECYTCGEMNTEHARRCIGKVGNKRCDHYFEFKECNKCGVQNDIAARKCRVCSAEIIDPNNKLELLSSQSKISMVVFKAQYCIGTTNGYSPSITAYYKCFDGVRDVYVKEFYSSNSQISRNIMYAKFIKLHSNNPSKYYLLMQNDAAMREMLGDLKTPIALDLKCKNNTYNIVEKHFKPEP